MVGASNRKSGGKKRGGDNCLEGLGHNQHKRRRDQLNGQGRVLVRPVDPVGGEVVGNITVPGSSRMGALEQQRVDLPAFGKENEVPKLEAKDGAVVGGAEPEFRKNEALPPEVLQTGLKKSQDRQDLFNFSLAKPELDGLLEHQKVFDLFARVIPEILNYLSLRDLLKCRLVCKQWLTSVNEIAEQRPFRAPYSDQFHLAQMASPNRRPRYRNNSWRYAKINLFIPVCTVAAQLNQFTAAYNRLKFSGGNPFFGRSLELNVGFSSVERLNLHTTVVHGFLRKFGHHVYHLNIRVEENQMPTRHLTYQNLMTYLRLMPNLRTLQIILREQHVPNLEQDRQDARSLAEQFRNPEDLKLEHLQTLELVQPPNVPVFYTHAILRPIRQQVCRLRVRCWIPEFENLFHSLRDLDLYKVENNQQLQALTHLQAPVEKLTLKFWYSDVDVGLLNLVVNRFPLRVLKLEWNATVKPVLVRPLLQQKVVSLHTLQMTHSLRVNYNFLLWFPNLKYLELTEMEQSSRPLSAPPLAKDLKKAEAWQRIQLQRQLYQDGMARSNVWTLIKHLTLIYFKRVRVNGVNGQMGVSGERTVKWERERVTATHWCIQKKIITEQ